MKIAIGNDHAATELKFVIMDYLKELGHEVINFGTDGTESCNYPEYGEKVGRAVVAGEGDCGGLICGTGVGISIGLTRLFYVLGEQGLLNPQLPTAPADVLILPMTQDLTPAIRLATRLRSAGVRTQLYTEQKKFKAKMNYADKLGVPYVVFLGDDEIAAGQVACKDMTSGEQTKLSFEDTLSRITQGLSQRNQGKVILEK